MLVSEITKSNSNKIILLVIGAILLLLLDYFSSLLLIPLAGANANLPLFIESILSINPYESKIVFIIMVYLLIIIMIYEMQFLKLYYNIIKNYLFIY